MASPTYAVGMETQLSPVLEDKDGGTSVQAFGPDKMDLYARSPPLSQSCTNICSDLKQEDIKQEDLEPVNIFDSLGNVSSRDSTNPFSHLDEEDLV
jgi:hypothetical protein